MSAGRFAPSPTGPLHMGSLLAAVASYLAARSSGLSWHVRFDDLDTPRNDPDAVDAILEALRVHGLTADEPPMFQSQQLDRYYRAIAQLRETHHCFYCTCSRRSLKAYPIYPGTCRDASHSGEDAALRWQVPDVNIDFQDEVAGRIHAGLTEEIGDLIVQRRDGIYAYHLACAVDDGDPRITQVVRGADLLRETLPQLALIDALQLSRPTCYAHIPVVRGADGVKLSKQAHAPPLDLKRTSENLQDVLLRLGLPDSPRGSGRWQARRWLDWAIPLFDLARVPRTHDV